MNNSTIAEYYYDPFGRRLWKDVDGIRTHFFYADEGLVAEYDSSGTEIRAYGYRPDSTWTTDPLWLKQGGEYYFYQNDHLGTPQKLVKQNGAISWSASYTTFGKAMVEVETVTNNLRFPGQYVDAETGLYYNWFRYYAPGIGRYLRVDPVNFWGGDNNLYRYASSNPIILIDPTGLINPIERTFGWIRTVNGGDNPINREIRRIESYLRKINNRLPEDRGAYRGIESHIFGGAGLAWVTCCDSNNSRKRFVFRKTCFGVAVGFSASLGVVTNFDCDPKSYAGWFFEVGAAIPWAGAVGGDFGKKSSDWEIPFLGIPFPTNTPSGVDEYGWGPSKGIPELLFKASWCYYVKIYEERIGCCLK